MILVVTRNVWPWLITMNISGEMKNVRTQTITSASTVSNYMIKIMIINKFSHSLLSDLIVMPVRTFHMIDD